MVLRIHPDGDAVLAVSGGVAAACKTAVGPDGGRDDAAPGAPDRRAGATAMLPLGYRREILEEGETARLKPDRSAS